MPPVELPLDELVPDEEVLELPVPDEPVPDVFAPEEVFVVTLLAAPVELVALELLVCEAAAPDWPVAVAVTPGAAADDEPAAVDEAVAEDVPPEPAVVAAAADESPPSSLAFETRQTGQPGGMRRLTPAASLACAANAKAMEIPAAPARLTAAAALRLTDPATAAAAVRACKTISYRIPFSRILFRG